VKISDILWSAANEHLWSGHAGDTACFRRSIYDAMFWALPPTEPFTPTLRFLLELGMGMDEHADFEEDIGEERQGFRYLWLDFARLVAEDEEL
jgi:hypothetical protein